jgi:DHA1 family tetracycline resistance protein-like MFS transporter
MMFRSPQNYRTFLTILMTYTLDLVGFSIVFPVLAPLLLNPHLHFFAFDTPEAVKTTVLGALFSLFGIAQFIGAPIAGALADHYGRYKVFLGSIFLSIIGYAILAGSVYMQSLTYLFVGRLLTGFCSGNITLAQSATADLTDVQHRSKAFSTLIGIGGLGFVAGPWIGGKLANPDWLSGSGAFIFAAVAALLNFIFMLFFFTETWKSEAKHANASFFSTFKDLRLVLHHKFMRTILTANLLFCIGWGFFLIFSPTYLVQKFSLNSSEIGDIFAYMALMWFLGSMFLNKELAGKFSLPSIILIGTLLTALGMGCFLWPNTLWPYWIITPVALIGASLSWINFNTLLSIKTAASMQGRAMGASSAMWSMGQIIAPLIAGPLAGWNIYSPIAVGVVFVLFSFVYFISKYKE